MFAISCARIFKKNGREWEKSNIFPALKNINHTCELESGRLAISLDKIYNLCIYDSDTDTFDSLNSSGVIPPVTSVMSSIGDTLYYLNRWESTFVKFDGKKFKSYNSLMFTKYSFINVWETYAVGDTIWFAINETGSEKLSKLCFFHDGKFGVIPLPYKDPLLKNMYAINIVSFAVDYKNRFWFLLSSSNDAAFHTKLYYMENGKMYDSFPEINSNKGLLFSRIYSIDKKVFAAGGRVNQSNILLVYDEDPAGLGVENEINRRRFCFEGAGPNPAFNNTTVEYSADGGDTGEVNADVYDLFGRKVKRAASTWSVFNSGTGYGKVGVDLSGLFPGFYLINIYDGTSSCSGSIIIRK